MVNNKKAPPCIRPLLCRLPSRVAHTAALPTPDQYASLAVDQDTYHPPSRPATAIVRRPLLLRSQGRVMC